MSPLRARMIEDMTLAGLALGTQKIWVLLNLRGSSSISVGPPQSPWVLLNLRASLRGLRWSRC
jgi:hypothetical protein